MATQEIIVNEYLGTALATKYARWKSGAVVTENTEAFKLKGQRPDIIVSDNLMSPVAIETEFLPANGVEGDAASRLGQIYLPTGGTIHSAVAVRLPIKYRQMASAEITQALEDEQTLEYCLLYGDSPGERSRWPATGFIQGSVSDLAHVIAVAKISPVTVAEGARLLEEGARVVAAILGSASADSSQLGLRIANHLRQDPGSQTFTMAATILINAFVFHETIAGTSDDLAEIRSIYGFGSTPPSKGDVILEWERILAINYWPIFGISKALIAEIPHAIWSNFIEACLATADRLLSLNLGKNPDLVGTIFQRLISDRRFLATFYTAPASAALLARLMIGPTTPSGADWSQTENVTTLRIADFACGTGSLLCTLYSEVQMRLENAGIDSSTLHTSMIERVLLGCDVVPSATYITASQLSSAFPTVQYKNTKILTMPFGRLDDGGVALGALDLLDKQGAMSIISTSAAEIGGQAATEVDAWKAIGGVAVDDQSFDLIAMNPPFTRLTGGGGKSSEVSRPLFAAFGTTKADQAAMAKRASSLFKGSAYHSNAGAASAFVEIGHRKLKSGGRIGLILPVMAMSGSSWEACRTLWRKHYRDIVVLTIASNDPGASAFSADTGVAECMFLGTRSGKPGERLVSVALYRKPASNLEGAEVGRRIREFISGHGLSRLEDGPFGGTAIRVGDEKIGEVLTAQIDTGPWPTARIRDHSVAQVAYQLANVGAVWLPGATSAHLEGVPVCRLGALGVPGPYHLDVSGSADSSGAPRGPFQIEKTAHPDAVSFPVLSAHNELRERYLEIAPDAEGIVRQVSTGKAQEVLARRRDSIWETRTKLHFATDARFNANGLIACLTTREALGGRAWPSFLLNDRRYEKAVAVWFNSSLGILAFWWLASKPQDGRGSVTTSRLADLVSFDPRALSESDLNEVDVFFDAFKGKPLRDIHECVGDVNRAELDLFVIRHLLKAGDREPSLVDGMQLLRAKLAMEPTIAGGRVAVADLHC